MSDNRTLSDHIYFSQDIPEAELRRLQLFKYPHDLSTQVLGDVKNKRVLDVGAGPNLMLGQLVRYQDGNYIPLDVNPKFLRLHADYCETTIEGDICNENLLGNIIDFNFDFVHMRFVLMHIDQEARPKIIRDLIAAAREKVVFLEYNWQTMTGSSEVNRFKEFTVRHAADFGMDVFYGVKLANEVAAATSFQIEVQNFARPKGQYYHELVPLAISTQRLVEKIKIPVEDQVKFYSIITSLEHEANLLKPPGFVPPSVACVIVKKKTKEQN